MLDKYYKKQLKIIRGNYNEDENKSRPSESGDPHRRGETIDRGISTERGPTEPKPVVKGDGKSETGRVLPAPSSRTPSEDK